MTDKSPLADFGRRKPLPPAPPRPPAKRSNSVALLLMGAVAVGGTGYLLMPHNRCDQNQSRPGNAIDPQQQNDQCRSSSGSSRGYSSGSRYYGSSEGSSSSGASHAGSSSVSRGGFGSMGHVFGFSGG